jgi:hypothetical protein
MATSVHSGAWSVAKLNGNTDQGVSSWIYVGDTCRFGSVWIGNGSTSTASCNYCGDNSGVGTHGASNASTCSSWVR